MGTTPENTSPPMAVSNAGDYEPDTAADYPMLDRTPAGNPTKPANRRDDLKPLDLMAGQVTEQIEPNMTRTRDAGPRLPFRGPLQHGAGTTISSTAEQMKRKLDNDLNVREAIYADGQTPEKFDITRGPHSRIGDGDSRSASELKDELARLSGEPDAMERRALDRAMGRG